MGLLAGGIYLVDSPRDTSSERSTVNVPARIQNDAGVGPRPSQGRIWLACSRKPAQHGYGAGGAQLIHRAIRIGTPAAHAYHRVGCPIQVSRAVHGQRARREMAAVLWVQRER